MKGFTVLLSVILMTLALDSLAATVEYQHPDLTIVAKDESLQSVLKSVGKEMRIFVTTPTGLNPLVSCDIQGQPVKLALKTLLDGMSYSLEWEEQSGRLVGLTILSGGGGAAAASVSQNSAATSVSQPAANSVAGGDDQGMDVPVHFEHSLPAADHDASMTGHEPQMEAEKEEREARMAEEREAHEAEMAARRQEQEIVHEARMREDIARKKEEEAVLFAEEAARRP